MVLSHLWDLEQVLEQRPGSSLREGTLSDLGSAEVVVVTAAAPLTVNQSRMVYLADNAAIVGGVLEALPAVWPGVLIVVTNPVDALCTWILRRTGLPRSRLLGYTLNDSLRLRTGIGQRLGVAPGSVEAWTIGEHGDAAVPLFSRLSVDGAPRTLSAGERGDVVDWLAEWYVRHVALDSGRSSTWTSGLGIARMVAACLGAGAGARDELWTASVMLDGEYGVSGVSLSVPVRLGAGGVHRVVEWPLDEPEAAGFAAAAAVVREAAASLE
jgi:malate/lactate dehydrogenase